MSTDKKIIAMTYILLVVFGFAMIYELLVINKTKQELNDSKNHIVEIINSTKKVITREEKLKQKAIQLYIEKNYVKIPKTTVVEISKNIIQVSKEEYIPYAILVGIIEVESSFNPSLCSNKGAMGLMQIMPEWAKKLNINNKNDLYDIYTNINAGAQVLKIHISEEKGNIEKGLYKYVGGSKKYAPKVFKAISTYVIFEHSIIKEGHDNSFDSTISCIKSTSKLNKDK